MRLRVNHYLTGLAAAAMLTAPVWAGTKSIDLDVDHNVTIAGTQLAPGDYKISVPEGATQANVMQNGNVIATVPCQWIQLPQKASYSQVQFNQDKVTEVDFSGKTEAVQFH
jgi:hypothetical protein